MKKTVLIISSTALLATFSCKKSTEGNKNVIVEENVTENVSNNNGKVDSTYSAEKTVKNGDNKVQEYYTYRYVADDGSSALVTFINTDKENKISIKSNNKTITVPQKEAWAKGAIYSDGNIEVKSEGDNITITQDNAVISLKKARGQ